MTMPEFDLHDILRSKKPGDEWYTFMCPEEFHFWVKKSPWDKNAFEKYGVCVVAIDVAAILKAQKNVIKYNHKAPLVLKNGYDVEHGYISNTITKNARFRFRIDSSIETNEILKGLSEIVETDMFSVKRLYVYNKKEGAELQFNIHNPDGNGSSLYFYRMKKIGRDVLYPDIGLNELLRVIAGFKDTMAHCSAEKVEQMKHGCALKKMDKKKRSKEIDSGRWIHL